MPVIDQLFTDIYNAWGAPHQTTGGNIHDLAPVLGAVVLSMDRRTTPTPYIDTMKTLLKEYEDGYVSPNWGMETYFALLNFQGTFFK